MSIGTLLAMPRAEGLFRRAILQSGAAHAVTPTAAARRIAHDLAGRLGVPATRESIAAAPVERLLQAQEELKADLEADRGRWGPEVAAGGLPWQPSVDGVVVPDRPIDRITAGAGAGIDLIVGTNVDEGRVALVVPSAVDRTPTEAVAAVATTFGLPADAAIAAYRTAHPGAGNGELLAALQTDGFWRVPALRLADAHAGAPTGTYMYEFAWPSPAFGGLLGACHGFRRSSRSWGQRWARTRPSSSPTPCTGPGSRSRRAGIPAGRATTSPAGRRCGSTPSATWSTTPGRPNGRCGREHCADRRQWTSTRRTCPGARHGRDRRPVDQGREPLTSTAFSGQPGL